MNSRKLTVTLAVVLIVASALTQLVFAAGPRFLTVKATATYSLDPGVPLDAAQVECIRNELLTEDGSKYQGTLISEYVPIFGYVTKCNVEYPPLFRIREGVAARVRIWGHVPALSTTDYYIAEAHAYLEPGLFSGTTYDFGTLQFKKCTGLEYDCTPPTPMP